MVQTCVNLFCPYQTLCKPKSLYDINDANWVLTGLVQVTLHLHRRLHLHVVLEDAAATQGLFVGLLCLGSYNIAK